MSATPLQRAPVPAGTAPRQRKKQTIRKTGLFGFFNPKDHACQTSPASKTAFAQHPQGRAKKPSLANPSQKEPATGHVPSSRFPNIRATPHLRGRARSLRQDMQKPKSQKAVGGARRDRTDDLKLAKLALSQLSYGPLASRPKGFGLGLGAGADVRPLRQSRASARAAVRPMRGKPKRADARGGVSRPR